MDRQGVRAKQAGCRDKVSSAADPVFGSINQRWRSLGATLHLVALATLILAAFELSVCIPHITFANLLPVLYVAVNFGRGAALIAPIASGLCAVCFY